MSGAEAEATALVGAGLAKAGMPKLKALLKALGQSQAGEKAELAERLSLFVEGAAVSTESGTTNPASLKIGELRKELAKRSLPCDTSIETRDELLRRLVDTLKRAAPQPVAAAAAGSGSGDAPSSDAPIGKGRDDIAIAKRVLELAETGDDEAILRLADLGEISRSSSVATLRKAYLNLSRSLHPDRLGRLFSDATKAFQALVGAFERLSQPEAATAGPSDARGKGRGAPATLARSNDNCFRTALKCPRCKVAWGQGVDGVEKYCYNFMMQGIKTFNCSTCLLDFGCMTAVHECPHCARPFDYSPADFHRQLACAHPQCAARTFGFHCFFVPPRVEEALRAEVKAAAEQRMKVLAGARSRAERMARKEAAAGGGGGGAKANAEAEVAEKAFVRGLADECPRCGWEPTRAEAKEELLIEHLRKCTNAKQHTAHRKRKAAHSARDEAKAAGRAKQDETMTVAAWQYLGGNASQMWMLTDEQLGVLCVEAGLESATEAPLDRTERIARLARHSAQKDASNLLTDGSAGVAPRARGRGGGGQAPSSASLPSNLHTLSLPQLRDVCAAHGFAPKGRSSAAVIKELEARQFAGESEVLLLD